MFTKFWLWCAAQNVQSGFIEKKVSILKELQHVFPKNYNMWVNAFLYSSIHGMLYISEIREYLHFNDSSMTIAIV